MTLEDARKPRVLLVEDDDDILRLLAIIAEEEGFDAACARGAIEAAHLLDARPFDGAIIDKNLPDGDGIRVATYALLVQEHMVVNVLTAYPTQRSILAAAEVGVVAYLIKPVDVIDLRATLREIRKRREELSAREAGVEDDLHTPDYTTPPHTTRSSVP